MVNRRYLFIEGAKDTSNGDLREGFGKLLEKKIKGKMPRISMGEGKLQTINKFKNSNDSKLLCDLDRHSSYIATDLNEYDLNSKKESVFYMIQEMEAWFISQPALLDKFYGSQISNKLAIKPATEVSEPDKELQRITKDTKKGTYHKIRHGAELLKLLDVNKLSNDFPDFKRLVECLQYSTDANQVDGRSS